ncbi:protein TRIGALACTOSYLDIACYLGLYCEROL 4 [Carex littledalei]|uniref:Protein TRIGALACTOSYLDIACYLGLYCEROL 4 n=1 Tax=Carex littledalei TaxID=544730 RepID=A0A833VSU6_9POAL|nr:protein TRIGALACTOSYLDIACYLGLYCEROL 4 [Carex littledalei]
MARLMRWATDAGGRWQLDMESPVTMEGTARPVPLDPPSLLGLSRGPRITRTKQLDFMHRFMSAPLVPSFCAADGGFFMHHAHLKHLTDKLSATILDQFDMQKLLSSIKESVSKGKGEASWSEFISSRVRDIMTIGAATELQISSSMTLLVEAFNINREQGRGKAIFQHKFAKHSLTMEAACPSLFVDKMGSYWDVPLLLGFDLASIGSGSGLSYHLCLHHLKGDPKPLHSEENNRDVPVSVPASLFPGTCAKVAISFKRNFDLWREKEGKVKMVQPYDVLLSDPHVSASCTFGGVASGSIHDSSSEFYTEKNKHAFLGDLFGSLSLTAQHGNFQRLFFDLTRLSTRLDFNSGSAFFKGATQLGKDLYHSQPLDLAAVHAVCPDVIVSLQQQIVGPFSFRMDSKITIDPRNKNQIARIDESVLAIDWALQVLGSAKATAWYSPLRKEGMVELRFFEI